MTKPRENSMASQGRGVGRAAARARQLLFIALTIAALAVGFLSSYYVTQPPGIVPKTGSSEAHPEIPDGPVMSTSSAAAAPDPLPIPEELPTTADALLAEADGMVRHLVDRFPEDPDAFEMMGRLQFYRGNTQEAVPSWEKCLALNPDYSHAYHGLGSVAAKQGDYQKAITLFRQALLLMPSSARTQIELSRTLIDQGELEEAILLLETNIRTSPGSEEARVLLGMAYLQRKDYEKAKQNYEAAVAINPRHALARFGLATASARLGLNEEAQQHSKVFDELRSGERELRRAQRNQYDDLQEMSKDVAEIYTNMARVFSVHNDHAAAEKLWQRAATLHPQDVNCRQALAWHHLQQGRPLETIRMFRELAALEPDNPEYPLEVARLYLGMNRMDEAEKTLRDLCEAAPQNATGFLALAELYMRTNQKPKESLALARTAVELAPTAANYVNLSAACEINADLPGAVAAMEMAIQKEPDNLQYRQMAALLKQKTGVGKPR